MKPKTKAWPALPTTVWALGFVSLFMDASSELVHAILPLFLAGTLGISVAAIGVIEGVAESIAQFAKLGSGALSDRMGKRKPWVIAGYGLSALTKPLFPLAVSVAPVAAARFLDRIGKGIRGAPRDALLADVTPEGQRGAAYGLRQGLDTIGAILGPLAATVLLLIYNNDTRAALWWAILPAAAALLMLMVFVREPAGVTGRSFATRPSLRDIGTLPRNFWIATAAAAVLTLARFSEAFLILRSASLGFAMAAAPVALVLMNAVYAVSSYPAGALSDRIGRKGLLSAGIGALVIADVTLGVTADWAGLAAGVALWGLHMGLTQGLLSAMVADSAPKRLHGTAFGAFYAISGAALLLASVIAGAMWEVYGPEATFLLGAGLATFSLLILTQMQRG